MHKIIAMMFTAAVAAVPATTPAQTTCKTGFNAQMTTSNGVLSLDAVANGTYTNLVVVGQPPPTPGGLVKLDGSSPKASLSFDVDGKLFGWVVGDIGHVSGIAIGVGAEKGYEEFDFTVTDDGSIYHRPTAATNMWLACNQTVNGEQQTILAWGNMGTDGGFPEGCGYTSVKQSCVDNLAPVYGR